MNDHAVGYGNEIQMAKTGNGSVYSKLFTVSFTAFLIVGFVWANYAILEELTRGSGRIIPSARLQVIQTLEPGIIKKILVREGETVTKGQLLMQIDDISVASKLGEYQQKSQGLSVRLARLQSEARGTGKFEIDADLKKQAPGAFRAEANLFASRKRRFTEEKAVLQHVVEQRIQEVAELNSKISRLKVSVKLINSEVRINKKYVRSRIVSKVKFLKLRRDANSLKRELGTTIIALKRAREATKEAEARISSHKETERAKLDTELADVAAELAVVRQGLLGARDRVVRTNIKSPVDGTINNIYKSTIGGITEPSKPVMDIVPTGENLLIEANILPKDIGFLHPGQAATVKITAYDYTIYGDLDAKLEAISADSFVNDDGDTFYKVKVRTMQNMLMHDDKEYRIIPGMVATVEIITGEKSILQYLLKPFLKARNEAMRER